MLKPFKYFSVVWRNNGKFYKKLFRDIQMISLKEFCRVGIISIVIAISFSLFVRFIDIFDFVSMIAVTFVAIFLAIFLNVLAKKVASFYFDSEMEVKIWEIQRYGFWPGAYLKKPLKAGIFFPLIFSLATAGYFIWMASLIFDLKPTVHRAVKRHGIYSYAEISEEHMGYIAAIGVVANLFFAFIGYLIGFSEFAKMNIYLAFFHLIPVSDLDGNKIFFGSLPLWAGLTVMTLLALGLTFLII